jgi:hypothetical protein
MIYQIIGSPQKLLGLHFCRGNGENPEKEHRSGQNGAK